MPTYQYVCRNCNFQKEEIVSVKDRNEPTNSACPQCGTVQLELVIGAPAIGDSVRLGIRKPEGAFKDVMKNIQRNHPKGKINI